MSASETLQTCQENRDRYNNDMEDLENDIQIIETTLIMILAIGSVFLIAGAICSICQFYPPAAVGCRSACTWADVVCSVVPLLSWTGNCKGCYCLFSLALCFDACFAPIVPLFKEKKNELEAIMLQNNQMCTQSGVDIGDGVNFDVDTGQIIITTLAALVCTVCFISIAVGANSGKAAAAPTQTPVRGVLV